MLEPGEPDGESAGAGGGFLTAQRLTVVMSGELVTRLLMGFYPAPLLFLVGFALVHLHVRFLAARGGESRYPEAIQRVVEKYRQEKYGGE